LLAHEREVAELGNDIWMIGTHSIHKGAVSYMASVPGGPPAASIFIRAGWTMGQVKDIYMQYVDSSDQFVGRRLYLLLLSCSNFASSPPYFPKTATNDKKTGWMPYTVPSF